MSVWTINPIPLIQANILLDFQLLDSVSDFQGLGLGRQVLSLTEKVSVSGVLVSVLVSTSEVSTTTLRSMQEIRKASCKKTLSKTPCHL